SQASSLNYLSQATRIRFLLRQFGKTKDRFAASLICEDLTMIPQQAKEATGKLDQLAINTIRTLAIDGVQKANSGHPGTPLGAAPTAYALWQRVLRYDPQQPAWPNRDRFVLSSGHASMLLYALIHLAGIKADNPTYEKLDRDAVTIDDIKTFRQAGSRCPGHPEYGWTSGVESTTGPLGQGVSTSVGMAIAGAW